MFGKGVPPDCCQAYAWARLAAETEDIESPVSGAYGFFELEWCQRKAAEIADVMSPAEMELACAYYQEFKRRISIKR